MSLGLPVHAVVHLTTDTGRAILRQSVHRRGSGFIPDQSLWDFWCTGIGLCVCVCVSVLYCIVPPVLHTVLYHSASASYCIVSSRQCFTLYCIIPPVLLTVLYHSASASYCIVSFRQCFILYFIIPPVLHTVLYHSASASYSRFCRLPSAMYYLS